MGAIEIEQGIDYIGLASDFERFFIERSSSKSDNFLQDYDAKRQKYLNWISLGVTEDFASTQLSAIFDQPSFCSGSNIRPISTDSFDKKYKDAFIGILKATIFELGEDNLATELFSKMVKENKDAAMSIINSLFIESFSEELTCVKILSVLNDYSYDELYPFSQTIALACLSNQSSRVKSAAFNLFAHWGNKRALELLLSIEPPTEDWIKMKYYKIKQSLEVQCSMQER